jgi:hypothetical protein
MEEIILTPAVGSIQHASPRISQEKWRVLASKIGRMIRACR